jgi:4'-phosphopantetheinyl transferase
MSSAAFHDARGLVSACTLRDADSATLWQPTPPLPSLISPAVHVWRLPVAPGASHESSARNRLLAHLTVEEHERMARLRHGADRARFGMTRGLLRELVGHYLAQPPVEIPLCVTPTGKPWLNQKPCRFPEARAEAPWEPTDIRFNVSHAGDWALVALSGGRNVGVDVERQRPMSDLDALARRFFSTAEAAALDALTFPEREAAFFRIWTRKEAFVKATGQGIAAGLDRFTVSHDEDPIVTLSGADGQGWTVRSLAVAGDYAAAVAHEGPPCPVWTWEWRDEGFKDLRI